MSAWVHQMTSVMVLSSRRTLRVLFMDASRCGDDAPGVVGADVRTRTYRPEHVSGGVTRRVTPPPTRLLDHFRPIDHTLRAGDRGLTPGDNTVCPASLGVRLDQSLAF